MDYFYNRITDRWISKGAVKEEDKEWYIFGLRSFFSGIFNVLYVILLGFILHNPLVSIVFLAVFVPAREVMGGYHSQTHLGCKAIMTFLFVIIIAAAVYLNYSVTVAVLALVNVFAGNAAIYFFCPAEHHNKPLTSADKAKFKKISFVIFNVENIIGIFVCFLSIKYSVVILLTLFIIWVMSITGYIKERGYSYEKD